MRKDPTAFRERFKRWKNGERVYDNGTPITDSYDGGKDDLDSLLDAGYTGPYGTKGYTSDQVNSRIEQRRQNRNNAIADRLQAAADATMLGVGLTGAGAIPATAYFGARGIGDISQGDYVGGTINTGLALIPAYSKARRSLKAVRGTNVRDYFKANPSKLSRYDMNTGEGKQLSEFWNKDVVPRMKKALSDEGAVSPDVYNNWFNKNFAQSRRIWHGTTPFKPNPQGYSEGTNAIIFADNGSLFNTPEKRYSSLAHELHHSQRSNTERFRDAHTTNSNNGYTAQEEAVLNNAYQFSEGFLNKHNIRPLHEKGAANTQLRATISANNGNATGKRLNKFIDNTSDEEITKILKSGSSYGADFVNSPTYNTKNIRKALKYVGGTAGVAYGLNKYDDGKDPTYNPKEGHLSEVTVNAKRTNFNPTYGYWDSLGQQWSTFNDLGQRVYRGAGWEPDVVLKTPQEYENYRQAQWKKADPNKTFEFSDQIRGIADTALWASAPVDAISELTGKYIINPVISKTVPKLMSKNVGNNIFNFGPSAIIGGVAGGKLGYEAGKKAEERHGRNNTWLPGFMGVAGAAAGATLGIGTSDIFHNTIIPNLTKLKFTRSIAGSTLMDAVTKPYTFTKLAVQGKYPFTRSQYANQVRNLYKARDEALDFVLPQLPYKRELPRTVGYSYKTFDPDALGEYDQIQNLVRTRLRINPASKIVPSAYRGNLAHEYQHFIQEKYNVLSDAIPGSDYYVLDPTSLMYDIYKPLSADRIRGNNGTWIKSPNEFDSEITKHQFIANQSPFHMLNRDDVLKLAKRFNITETQAENMVRHNIAKRVTYSTEPDFSFIFKVNSNDWKFSSPYANKQYISDKDIGAFRQIWKSYRKY